MASCPECGSTYVRRIARTPLMRLLWSSEHILCSDCGERSLVFPKLRKFAAKKRVPRPRPRLKPDNPLHSIR
jgi:DNA-directed RNA polymerase subunit RPC12/RpoP